MRHNKVIYLISTTIAEDEYGNQIEEETERKVYANEYSIGSSEFYNAAVTGLRPEIAFEIYSFEYNGEEKFKYDGEEYNIIRTQGKGEKMVLIGEKVAGNG
jgi:SPP1 family predicted phage head-tail adaptor